MDELVKKIRELNDSGLYTKAKISEITGVNIATVKRMCSKSYDKVMEHREARKIADMEFENLVIKYLPLSNSLNHLCTYLGLRGVDGYYNKIKKVIEKYDLSTSHFGTIKVSPSGNGRNKFTKMADDEFFCENTKHSGQNIIDRLINGKFKEYKCEECGLTEWNNKPIRLQIHHINGIHTDNRLENLQILCPNCHTQTDTYAANNKNKVKINGFKVLKRRNEILNNEISTFKEKDIAKVEIKEKNKEVKKCSVCGKEFVNDNGKYCSLECAYIGHKKIDINSEQLIEDIKTLKSFKKVGDKYGVSDNTIRKKCIRFGIYDKVKEYITSRKRKLK